MFVDFNILNQLGSPSINSNTFANRPAAGQTGRLFVSIDTFEIYRDNGTTWDLIGGPGSSTVTGTGAATQVAYWTAAQAIGGSNNLWWDNTNGYLGIKTNAPTAGVNIVQTDGQGVLSDFTTVAGSGSSAVAVYAKNTTNSSGFAAIFEERTPNSAAGQYPIKISHTLSSGTAAANMATGIHFGLPDDAGTERIMQMSTDTVDPAAATYSSRYRFLLRNAGAAATPFYITGAGIGIYKAAPSGLIHADGGANVARMILDADNNVARIFSFRTDDLQRWAFRVDGNETGTNAGADLQVRRYNDAGTFIDAPVQITRSTGHVGIGGAASSGETLKVTGSALIEHNYTQTTGVNRNGIFSYLTTTTPNGASYTAGIAYTAIGALHNDIFQGSATIPRTVLAGGFSGQAFIQFNSGPDTVTIQQGLGGQLRSFAAIQANFGFSPSQAGCTVTHASGFHAYAPIYTGANNPTVTNYYGIALNDTTEYSALTITNRWGVYQAGLSDLNYMAANLLLGSTVNNGDKLQVNGAVSLSGNLTVDTNVLFVDSSNNRVGIGTTTLTNKLTVIDSQTGTQVTTNPVGKFVNTGNAFSKFILGSDNANFDAVASMDNNATLANCKLRFYIGNGTGSTAGHSNDQFVITGNNNIGIGTDNPAQLLHLATQLATSSGVGTAIQIESGGAGGDQGWIGVNKGAGNGLEISIENRDIIFNTGATTPFGGTERVRISNTGNFLVGTQSNTSRLIVVGGNSNTGFEVDNGVGYTYLQSYDRVAATHRDMYFYTTGPATMILKNSGNLLIGTTTDAGYKLDVAGSFRNTTDVYLNTSSGATNIARTSNLPTITVPSGQATVLNIGSGTVISYNGSFPSPYTQNLQIDIVFNNWGGNNVIALVDLMVTVREYAATSGTAFGKLFALPSGAGSTFATFDTTNITTSQCTLTATSGGNYTLRITIDPTNNTDTYGLYLNVLNGAINTAISSITISLV